MLRKAALVAFSLLCIGGPASAGVLSATDMQRLRDYEQFVVPADREKAPLREMAGRVDALIAAAESSGESAGGGLVDFPAVLHDFPAIGGATIEKMVSSLQAIHDPRAFAPAAWVAMLTEVKAEIGERLAYDAEVLRAYQRSLAQGAPSLGQSLVRWDERPNAAAHWSRFQQTFERAPAF